MVLTAFTLVAAMDKLACCRYPLLLQYSCGIASGSVLDALLLPHRHELELLEAVQQYVQQRSNLQPSMVESIDFAAAFAEADKVRYMINDCTSQSLAEHDCFLQLASVCYHKYAHWRM
jgi:hypothetical protein